jgi:hypothetical protein
MKAAKSRTGVKAASMVLEQLEYRSSKVVVFRVDRVLEAKLRTSMRGTRGIKRLCPHCCGALQ